MVPDVQNRGQEMELYFIKISRNFGLNCLLRILFLNYSKET